MKLLVALVLLLSFATAAQAPGNTPKRLTAKEAKAAVLRALDDPETVSVVFDGPIYWHWPRHIEVDVIWVATSPENGLDWEMSAPFYVRERNNRKQVASPLLGGRWLPTGR